MLPAEVADAKAAEVMNKYAPAFPSIRGSWAVSCQTLKLIAEVRSSIHDELRRISHEVPSSYILLQRILLAERSRMVVPVMTWAEITDLCLKCQIPKSDLAQAAHYFHDNGLVYYIRPDQDQDISDGVVVLDRQWLAGMFLAFDSEAGKKSIKSGILHIDDLPAIWDEAIYPARFHSHLMRVLARFNMIFTFVQAPSPLVGSLITSPSINKISCTKETEDDMDADRSPRTYGAGYCLVPALLPLEKHTRSSAMWPYNPLPRNSVRYEEITRIYKFDYIPHSLISQVIVKFLRLNAKSVYWKNGIIISTPDRSTTLFEFDAEKMFIKISVRGSGLLFCSMVEVFEDILFSLNNSCNTFTFCPHCISEGSENFYIFSYQGCKKAVLEGRDYVTCEFSSREVSLDSVVPDLSLSSVPKLLYSDLTLQEKIGRGSYASIFKGTFQGNTVAIKKYNTDNSASALGKSVIINTALLKDIHNEVTLMTEMEHPNIVKCYGISLNPLSMVTEYLSHSDLFGLIHNPNFEMGFPLVLRFAFQISCAMRYMHNHVPPIIHRDLKSPNCLVTREPSGEYECKVADFGLSRFDVVGLFVESNVDNPAWLAPEILLKEVYGLESDVYSFGMIMWEMITRKPLEQVINASFAYQTADFIMNGYRPPIPDHCDVVLSTLISDCWSQNTAKRPSFAEITQRLLMIIESNEKTAHLKEYAQKLNAFEGALGQATQ
jgi:hypothetical protein